MTTPADTLQFFAHIRARDHQGQSVADHLQSVRIGCEVFGGKIGVAHLAGLAGLLHDLGKNTPAFQQYLQDAVAHPENPPRKGSVDHSTAGGRFLYRRFYSPNAPLPARLVVEWVANAIISHHQGLRDYLDPHLSEHPPFFTRIALKTEGMDEYALAEASFREEWLPGGIEHYFAQAQQEIQSFLNVAKTHSLESIYGTLLIKYLFSCLIDADRTDTRQFEEGQEEPWNTHYPEFFARSYEKLLTVLQEYETRTDASRPINQWRAALSQQCDTAATRLPGLYTLSIPTGGGKTLSSLRFALKHAQQYGKDRIIYIVPYTTIIEQNAQEIRDILQADDLILEHHSNVVADREYGEMSSLQAKRLALAKDNWDRPLIFTTMVQFLNTFYAQGTRNARRLHRLANAVLIFDEVQAIPIHCIALFNASLNFLTRFARSTVLLCTATQPVLTAVHHPLDIPDPEQAEIIADPVKVSQQFQRVVVEDRTNPPMGTQDLLQFLEDRLQDVHQILVILNTKSAVRKLYAALTQSSWVQERSVKLFHLSTSMCGAHRQDVFADMKEFLARTPRQPVVCISTQLIEAGVNISFECVIRSLAGLDSIAQAAGRCNRHGKDPLRTVYVIQSTEENLTSLKDIRVGATITQRIFREFADDPEQFLGNLLSPQAMTRYFKYYYQQLEDDQIKYSLSDIPTTIYDLLNKNQSVYDSYIHTYDHPPDMFSRPSFATAESHFHVIESATHSVLVPYNAEAQHLIATLNGAADIPHLGALLRQAQRYVVNVFDHEMRQLQRQQALYPVLQGQAWALRPTAYSPQFGIDLTNSAQWPLEVL